MIELYSKYTAIIIILIILVIFYLYYRYSSKVKKPVKGGTKGKKSNGKKSEKKVDYGSEPPTADSHNEASELFNLVHDGLCKGMKTEEFVDIVGDLADTSTYIELRQIYNKCLQDNLDPDKNITVKDYVRVLKSESN